jgi:hypothetical protein
MIALLGVLESRKRKVSLGVGWVQWQILQLIVHSKTYNIEVHPNPQFRLLESSFGISCTLEIIVYPSIP